MFAFIHFQVQAKLCIINAFQEDPTCTRSKSFWQVETGYGTLQCERGFGSCPGANNDRCYPYIVCSSKLVGSSNAWSPELNGGRFYEYNGDAGHAKTYATTVRCVLDLGT